MCNASVVIATARFDLGTSSSSRVVVNNAKSAASVDAVKTSVIAIMVHTA